MPCLLIWRLLSRALAMELQNEEDERARRDYAKREQERAARKERERGQYDERRWHGHGHGQDRHGQDRKPTKKEKDCVIM